MLYSAIENEGMCVVQNDKNIQQLASPEQMLRGLVRELTEPLLYIARQAEFSATQTTEQVEILQSIERAATSALRLIDSYLLSAQHEYGQKQLPLQAVGTGAVLYDVAHELSLNAKQWNYVIEVDNRYAKPIMTDASVLKTSLACLGMLLMSGNIARESKVHHLRLAAYKHGAGQCVIGALDADTTLVKRDLEQARKLQGGSHMALAKLGSGSGIQFALADSLANALNTELCLLRRRKLTGFGLVVSKSDQLQLVA